MDKTVKNNMPEDKDLELWALLNQSERVLSLAHSRELRKYNITPRHAAVLFAIKICGGIATISEIAQLIFREHHSTSGIVTRCEKKGLVSKNDFERNITQVRLTKKGEAAYEHSSKRILFRSIFSCLSSEEHRQMMSSLRKIRDRAIEYSMISVKPPYPPPVI